MPKKVKPANIRREPEVVASFTFCGVTEKVTICEQPDGTWEMHYWRANGIEQAGSGGLASRKRAIEHVKQFMLQHAPCLLSNVLGSEEDAR